MYNQSVRQTDSAALIVDYFQYFLQYMSTPDAQNVGPKALAYYRKAALNGAVRCRALLSDAAEFVRGFK